MTEPSFQSPPHQIELQLLRHSEAYSLLLSPVTDYLALCGDHPAETINIPLTHRALLTRLRALDYKDSSETQIDQLDELSAVVSRILAEFPGFSTELSRCDNCLAHVSLATSAAELAMVPFELAMMPPGTAGAAQRICLQPHIPVCLTRRSRNVNRPRVNWNRPYRILMISSDAGGMVPAVEHYSLLRKIIDPWVNFTDRETYSENPGNVDECLVLMTNPTVNDIREMLQQQKFTHIHLLAHGAAKDAEATRFGVALHSRESSDGIDIVDGERLGGLFGHRPDQPDHSPLVVTLAVCQSGRQGSVAVPGSSLAFELHNKGVPVVVGSQFPLSFGGSIVMTGELYEGLLNGQDPRNVIWRTRAALHAAAENTMEQADGKVQYSTAMHDWASMTVYAEFPDDFDDIIPHAERSRIVSRLTPKMAFLDSITHKLHVYESGSGSDSPVATVTDDDSAGIVWKELLDWSALQKPRDEIQRLRSWIENHRWQDSNSRRRASSKGILASAQKRLGLVFLQIAAHGRNADVTADEESGSAIRALFDNVREQELPLLEGVDIASPADLVSVLEKIGFDLLHDAKLSYDEVFRLARSEGWALVQSLSLSIAAVNELPQRSFETAWHLNNMDLSHPDGPRRTWALAAVAELILQALVHRDLNLALNRPPTFVWPDRDLKHDFRRAVESLSRMAWQEPNEVRSALLQLKRFDTDLIELAAMNSQAAPNSEPAAPTGFSSANNPWEQEFVRNFSKKHRAGSRRRMKAWISQTTHMDTSEMFTPERDEQVWNVIRDLRTFVGEVVDPLFVQLDIRSYR